MVDDGESSLWSTAKRLKKIKGFHIDVGFNKTMRQLAMENSVRWYGHELRMEDAQVPRRALNLEIEGQRKMGGRRGNGKFMLVKKV